jgi:hypothetical protein
MSFNLSLRLDRYRASESYYGKRGMQHLTSSENAYTLRKTAGVAQLAEQAFCERQVMGSMPVASSDRRKETDYGTLA